MNECYNGQFQLFDILNKTSINKKMKIRRIDKQNILSHARNYQRTSHFATASQCFNVHQLSTIPKSQRESMQIKLMKQKLLSRKQRKKQNHVLNQDSVRIMAVLQKLKFFYTKLSDMYSTNQNKLTSLLVKHIKIQYYIFSKEILQLIRNFRVNKENISICYHSQPKKVLHQLTKFKEYLQGFYERKCLKQIQIIQENILQREQAIRYNTPFDRYKKITKSFRPSLITNNIDISQEFKLMSAGNGGFRQLSRVQNSLFRKLRQTEHKISKVFMSVCTSKEKDQFMCRIQDIS